MHTVRGLGNQLLGLWSFGDTILGGDDCIFIYLYIYLYIYILVNIDS